ncbi:MAG TPA: flagellar hook assembly protein FlgD [Acetobacteraceae bacterium]
MSMASVTAQQNSSQAAAGSASSGSSSATTGQNALNALSGNFSDFLNMLMTQLQNQDPTSPMDTNEFTSELVEFSGVEQQINTNNSLSQLIQLTQSGEVMQGSSMTGKQVTVNSSQIPLQNGSGQVEFTTTAAEPVGISITNGSGQLVRTATMNATAGQNSWTWNGTNNAGNSVADGAYNIAVVTANGSGGTTAVPFTVTGTATGIENTGTTGVQLELGAMSVNFGSIVALGN